MKMSRCSKKLKLHPLKIKPEVYPGGEEEKQMWQRWFWIMLPHGIFFREYRRRKLFQSFVRGIRDAERNKNENCYMANVRRRVYIFAQSFYRYFLNQSLRFQNTPQEFDFEDLIADAINERYIA